MTIESRKPVRVSLIGFGRPSDPQTTSGFASSMHAAIAAAGHLKEEYSLKRIRLRDVLFGAVLLRRSSMGIGMEINRAWMWSEAGCATLSDRLMREVEKRNDQGPFLQFGTLARLPSSAGAHFMRTDMTVAQARRAKSFAVGKMSPTQLDTAEEVQCRNLETAAGVFASCEWTAESLVKDCGVPRQSIHIIYTGGNLDFSGCSPPESRREEILFVGRDWDRKGGPLLTEAFQRVSEARPNAILTVVGCKPPVLSPGVKFEGHLDPDNKDDLARLQSLYLRAACFCLPAGFDPFPNVLIEAAWAGLPTVTIDTGSRAEAVIDGKTGLLIPEPDPALLADALIKLLSDPVKAAQMGREARKRAEEKFCWSRIVEKVLQVMSNNESASVDS